VERSHRTLTYACLLIHAPETEEQVREVHATFVTHSNQERPNQARTCGNQPPRVACAELPSLPGVPDVGDPHRWLRVIAGQHFVGKVRHHGTVLLAHVESSSKHSLAGQDVDVCVDANTQAFVIWHQHQPCKRIAIKGLLKTALSFDRFVALMSQQALCEQRNLAQAHRRTK
jgi:hypothetical protein